MDRRIIPYIPFSCALLQKQVPPETFTGTTIDYGFTAQWFADRTDIDFGAIWHSDPFYRYQSFRTMAGLLNRVFPHLKLGGELGRIRGSISGVQSCALPAAFFGQPILYNPKGWPINESRVLTESEVEELDVPDFRAHPAYENLMLQMDQIEKEWGVIEGELNFQSVMNTAFRLRGADLFLDMYDNPQRVDHLYDVIYRTLVQFIDEVHSRQTDSGAERSFFVTANCVVNMISDEHYRRFLQPHDKKLYRHYRYFGIHNCNWSVDDYLDSYREIGKIRYLDFGIDSDLQRLKDTFPDATRVMFYRLNGKVEQDIDRDLQFLHDSDACSRIYLSAVDTNTPDSLIQYFFDAATRIWKRPVQELLAEPPNY
jgi:hypothetical protein